MSQPPDSKPVTFSQTIYRRLLAVYPENHRQEFGDAMAQLFQDQTRAAWAESRGWGLATLWLRTSIDTVTTASTEHFHNLKNRKSMFHRLSFPPIMKSSPTSVFVILFVAVLIFATSVTVMLPKAYASKARVKIPAGAASSPQTELIIVQSDTILDRVIADLGLNNYWKHKYHTDATFTTPESRTLLRKMIQANAIRDTQLIEITVFSDDRFEAPAIANSLAKAYAESNQAKLRARGPQAGIVDKDAAEIIDNAEPALRPSRPNLPLNIFLGAFVAAIIGGAGVSLSRFLQRQIMASRTAAPLA